MKLLSLQPEGIRLVTPELAAGTLATWPENAWKPVIADAENAVSLEALDGVLHEALRNLPRHDASLDAWLAPRLHMALPLSRRQAADAGCWRYLAVVHRPELVRHRWENLSWTTMKSRFWSVGTRHTSNVFSRLWWIAELTRDGESFDLTSRVLARQSLAIQIFVRSWSQYRPAVEAFTRAFEDAPAERVEHGARMLSRYLATAPLEGLSREDLAKVLRSFSAGT